MSNNEPIVAYKAFNADWTCRDQQYEVGQTYEMDGDLTICQRGYHACEYPLNCFDYYPPTGKLAEVRCERVGEAHEVDTKLVCGKITIVAELSLAEWVERAVKYTFDRAKRRNKETATGYRVAASATGDQGAASATGLMGAASATGFQGAASATGIQGAASATGLRGAASATGNQGAASATGIQGAASATGFQGAASATGFQGAASATGVQGAASATGFQGAASATGNQGAASATGDQGAASATGVLGAASATGKHSSALGAGLAARAQASAGCALFLVERTDDGSILHVFSGIAGRDGVQPDTWYTLRDGDLVEAA